jgi:hypothetical protein
MQQEGYPRITELRRASAHSPVLRKWSVSSLKAPSGSYAAVISLRPSDGPQTPSHAA